MAQAHWVSVVEPRALPEPELHHLLRRSYELARTRLTKSAQLRLAEMDAPRD
jgi:predicted DNA-binding protein (MmcQ/YjbR family)